MLTYRTTLFVIRAGATGGLALGQGDGVVDGRAVRVEFLEYPDDAVAGLIPDGAEGVLGASDPEGKPADAVADGGRAAPTGAAEMIHWPWT